MAVSVVREPEAVPIVAELGPDTLAQPESPVAVDPQILAEPMPIDAIEAAARLIARDLAARKAARGYPVPRRRRRIGDEVRGSQEPSISAGSGKTADHAGPSIDWLRP
jgi:hypothetical protein